MQCFSSSTYECVRHTFTGHVESNLSFCGRGSVNLGIPDVSSISGPPLRGASFLGWDFVYVNRMPRPAADFLDKSNTVVSLGLLDVESS